MSIEKINIIKFLLECNKLMDGIYIEEITEDVSEAVIKFEAKMTCLYVNPGWWTPLPIFFEVLMKAGKKYLGTDEFNFNNTKTIFWIYKN